MNSYTLSFENLVASAFVVNFRNCFEKKFISYEDLNDFERSLYDIDEISIRVSRGKYFLKDLVLDYGNHFSSAESGISLSRYTTIDRLICHFTSYLPVEVIRVMMNLNCKEEDFSVGARIAKFRESKGMTQREVARKIGRTPAAICKWESGERTPGVKDIINLCILFGITADKLIIIPS